MNNPRGSKSFARARARNWLQKRSLSMQLFFALHQDSFVISKTYRIHSSLSNSLKLGEIYVFAN